MPCERVKGGGHKGNLEVRVWHNKGPTHGMCSCIISDLKTISNGKKLILIVIKKFFLISKQMTYKILCVFRNWIFGNTCSFKWQAQWKQIFWHCALGKSYYQMGALGFVSSHAHWYTQIISWWGRNIAECVK